MNRNWLLSPRMWLAVCVIAGALIVTIDAHQTMRQFMDVADALSSGIREGLQAAGGHPHEDPRRFSVSFLFGLFTMKDTPHPLFWADVSGIVTGGLVGALVWGVAQWGLRIRGRGNELKRRGDYDAGGPA
jgi:hypothetical protein